MPCHRNPDETLGHIDTSPRIHGGHFDDEQHFRPNASSQVSAKKWPTVILSAAAGKRFITHNSCTNCIFNTDSGITARYATVPRHAAAGAPSRPVTAPSLPAPTHHFVEQVPDLSSVAGKQQNCTQMHDTCWPMHVPITANHGSPASSLTCDMWAKTSPLPRPLRLLVTSTGGR